jgi:hypothetical protein
MLMQMQIYGNVNMCNCKCIYVVEVILGNKALFQEIRMKYIKWIRYVKKQFFEFDYGM